ncbi:MAG TPA: SDR family oxidoreductase [Candidatus Acidoferrales bacterium]|nr:SDR family oxidoreductase [Candidatus Acidoferrales bacterium]
MDDWRGKWVLVTGASAGIGRALAQQLAGGGASLVLTARRRERLEQLRADLNTKYGVQVEVFAADLARPRAPDELFTFTQQKGINIELLVNNAGFGAYGEFFKIELARQLEMVQVNISAVIHLTHLYLPPMIERRRGDILIVASTAGFQGVPYITTYAATKAFDLLFAEALAEEVRRYGIRVSALCPGSTETEFRYAAGQPERTQGHPESAEKVARVGLEALAKGKSSVISGVGNLLGVLGQRLAPRRLVTRVAAKLFEPVDAR